MASFDNASISTCAVFQRAYPFRASSRRFSTSKVPCTTKTITLFSVDDNEYTASARPSNFLRVSFRKKPCSPSMEKMEVSSFFFPSMSNVATPDVCSSARRSFIQYLQVIDHVFVEWAFHRKSTSAFQKKRLARMHKLRSGFVAACDNCTHNRKSQNQRVLFNGKMSRFATGKRLIVECMQGRERGFVFVLIAPEVEGVIAAKGCRFGISSINRQKNPCFCLRQHVNLIDGVNA
jgi:hypothetical protein